MLQAGIPIVADVSAVTVTAVACKLAITVEVVFNLAVRNNLDSVGAPTYHGVLVAVLQAPLMLHGLTVVGARLLFLLSLHDVFLLFLSFFKNSFLFKTL